MKQISYQVTIMQVSERVPSYGVSGGPAISPLSSVKLSPTSSTFIWFLLVCGFGQIKRTLSNIVIFLFYGITALSLCLDMKPHTFIDKCEAKDMVVAKTHNCHFLLKTIKLVCCWILQEALRHMTYVSHTDSLVVQIS